MDSLSAPGVSSVCVPVLMHLLSFLCFWVFVQRVKPTMSWQWAAATVHPFPHSSVGRKLEQCVYACVLDTVAALCVREDERSHSYYIKQDFPEQSAPATELPKSSSGFPPQHKLCGRTESRLFVLEHHCSGAAEAMSQHRVTPPTCHALLNY